MSKVTNDEKAAIRAWTFIDSLATKRLPDGGFSGKVCL
jgi:hypothetical protein